MIITIPQKESATEKKESEKIYSQTEKTKKIMIITGMKIHDF